jgi:hypothetical protein
VNSRVSSNKFPPRSWSNLRANKLKLSKNNVNQQVNVGRAAIVQVFAEPFHKDADFGHQ